MSTAARRRKLARERVHARNVALAQSLAEKQRSRWESEGADRGRREERERRRVFLDPHEDDYLLSPVPEYDVKLVALHPRETRAFADYARDYPRFPVAHVVQFKAVRKTWRAGTGQTVTWWDWEFRGPT